MEINDIFSAEPNSVWKVLCEPGVGFYVPAYQRSYTWNKTNINRLFDDLSLGLTHLLNSQDAITFIGTLIAIHDTQYQTVQPHVQGELPGRVMLVIDGQQRLTTLLLVNAVVAEEIFLLSKRFEGREEIPFKWIVNESRKLRSELKATYSLDMTYGDEGYQYYPRMVRAYEDSWSRSKDTAEYNSPIAKYLHGYIAHWESNTESRPYAHKVDKDLSGSHKIIVDNIKTIRSVVNKAVCRNSHPDINLPEIDEMLESKEFQRILLNTKISDEVIEYLRSNGDLREKERYQHLFRLIIFAKFLLHRMAVTVVTAKNEDYAFDMFEALNTTGEPLTAFETFKPKVIQAENIAKYEHSESRKYIEHVDEYLEEFKKAQDKQKATTEMLVPFSLSETGTKLSKRLSDQRKYLRDEFDNLNKIEDKRSFVQHLSHCATFIREGWPSSNEIEPYILGLSDEQGKEALLCLDLLKASGHTISIAPILRYFSQMRILAGEERDLAVNEFINIVKALTAFFVIWRSSHRSTSGIDSHIRKLVKDGVNAVGLGALCRRNSDGLVNKLPNVTDVLPGLRYILENEGNISSDKDWIKTANSLPIYDISTPITRFLLVAASHDTVPDNKNLGLIESARSGQLDMLNFSSWKHTRKLEIEHVAPINPSGGWSNNIYDDKDVIHRIGNLALAPKIENIVLGNRPWSEKKIIYKVLSSATINDLEDLMNDAQKIGLDLSEHSQEILKESKFLPHVQAISMYNDEWDLEFIARRGERMLSLAWSRISGWLGY